MTKIPKHKISDDHCGKMAYLKYISADSHMTGINYAHRDDYYLFLFQEEGEVQVSVDFEEYNVKGAMVHCVLPGQVHHIVDYNRKEARIWVLVADCMLVQDGFREVFASASLIKSKIRLSEEIINDLKCCASILYRRLNEEEGSAGKKIIHSLLLTYIGIIAEAYQKGLPVSANKCYAVIMHQFRSLLSANYKTMKSPSQYATVLNISSVYLNEAVKKTTGLTVTGCIQNEIITQAKRLLFYTDMNVREVAIELGYDDWAYFTRLFTKVSGFSPTEFRTRYLR